VNGPNAGMFMESKRMILFWELVGRDAVAMRLNRTLQLPVAR